VYNDCPRSLSTIQGRPLGIGDNTFDVPLPELDDNDLFPGAFAEDTMYLKYSTHGFKMAKILSKIKVNFYHLPNHTTGLANDLRQSQEIVREELNQWLLEVPQVVAATGTDQQLRLITKLKIQYHTAICLLYQPSQAIIHPDDRSLQICFESATQRLRLYELLYDSGSLIHSFRTVQDMGLAGATAMYCVWMSKSVRKTVPLSTIVRDFRRCSSLLSAGGEWWPVTRKANISLERLANQTLEMLARELRLDIDGSEIQASPQTQEGHAGGLSSASSSYDGPSESIEEVLAAMLNQDGGSSIFDTAPIYDPMQGVPDYAVDNYGIAADLWMNLDQSEFATTSQQLRAEHRELGESADNLTLHLLDRGMDI
jgi:hypothetical protein